MLLAIQEAPALSATTLLTLPLARIPIRSQNQVEVIDERGLPHTVSYTLTKQADSTWTLDATVGAADGTVIDGSVTGIEFSSDGSFRQVSGTGLGDASLTFQFSNGTAPITLGRRLRCNGNFFRTD